jgi:hypothetical protein
VSVCRVSTAFASAMGFKIVTDPPSKPAGQHECAQDP